MESSAIDNWTPEQSLRETCADSDRRLRAGEKVQSEVYLKSVKRLAQDPELGIELGYTDPHIIRSMCFTPDGRRRVVGCD